MGQEGTLIQSGQTEKRAESTDRKEVRVVTQNNHLVGARLDRTQTSRIKSFSGEFQAASGRNLPADTGWETGTDLTAPRGRPRTSPQQPRIFLDLLTSCPPRCGSVGGSSGTRAVQGRLARAPSRGSLSFSGPQGHPPLSPLPENRAARIHFLPGLLAVWFLWSAGGSVAPRSCLPVSPPPVRFEKRSQSLLW